MKGLEEENAELRSKLKSGLSELASIDPKEQEQILEIARRTGQSLPDAGLVKKLAREEDLALPLFQHAKAIGQADTAGPVQSSAVKDLGKVSSSTMAGVSSPREPITTTAAATTMAPGGTAGAGPLRKAADAAS